MSNSKNQKNLNEILSIGNDVLSSSTRIGTSVYHLNLFEGLSDKQKKSTRSQLRKKLQKFIDDTFVANLAKDKTKLSEIKKVWDIYAKNIYKDVNVICDSNTNETKQNDVKAFLGIINNIK